MPLRIVEAYRALAHRPRRADPARVRPRRRPIGRRIELAPAWPHPIELRPCHNDLLNANFIDDGARIRIVDWEYAGMGDPFFDLGNFSINHELDAGRGRGPARGLRRRRSGRDRLARLTLMRVVSDFREAMWGVLQQGISTLDVDFVAYAGEHFDRLLPTRRRRPGVRARRCAERGRGG